MPGESSDHVDAHARSLRAAREGLRGRASLASVVAVGMLSVAMSKGCLGGAGLADTPEAYDQDALTSSAAAT